MTDRKQIAAAYDKVNAERYVEFDDFLLGWQARAAIEADRSAAPAEPVWTQAMIDSVNEEAERLRQKLRASPMADAEPEQPVAIGDYVLATKWDDGDPGDHWGVGFYDGQRGDRHFVIDSEGMQIRHNGFRRVGRIAPEIGKWLLSAATALEQSPPGSVNLWRMLAPHRSDAWVAEAMRLADEYAEKCVMDPDGGEKDGDLARDALLKHLKG